MTPYMRTKVGAKNVFDLFFEFLFVSVMYGAFLAGGGMLAVARSAGFHVSLRSQYLFVFVVWILASLIWVFWRAKRYRRKEVWELTGGQLCRGAPVNLRVDLSNVEKAILGMPKSKRYRAMDKQKVLLSQQARLKAIYDCTIVLKLDSSQYLPLYLAELGGGLEIMNKVLGLVSEKLEKNYQYNKAEEKALKPRKLNSVVRLEQLK